MRWGRAQPSRARERRLPIPAHHIVAMPPPFDRPPYPADIFAGHSVLVTGGGSRMGLAMDKAFAQGGPDVAVVGRSIERAQAGTGHVPTLGMRPPALSCDVRPPDPLTAAFPQP